MVYPSRYIQIIIQHIINFITTKTMMDNNLPDYQEDIIFYGLDTSVSEQSFYGLV